MVPSGMEGSLKAELKMKLLHGENVLEVTKLPGDEEDAWRPVLGVRGPWSMDAAKA